MKIIYTKQAKRKFRLHRQFGWKFHTKNIEATILNPDFFQVNKSRVVKIALKSWDEEHDLRVIYKQSGGIITVITFYPTEKGRYIK